MRIALHLTLIILLTILTQVGGLAWALALLFRRRFLGLILGFVGIYGALTLLAIWTAPLLGRTALSCQATGPLQMQSWFYCLSNRNYATPELWQALKDSADSLTQTYPGTRTLVLDAGFPFLDGFPLLPHLSHDDGEKVDLAFYYADAEGDYQPDQTRSPIGYFAFEQGESDCPSQWLSLRWDLDWLQPLWKTNALEPKRNRLLIERLAADPRIGKIFVEPHLQHSLGVSGDKIRFQGCRAARHDDHIHVQL